MSIQFLWEDKYSVGNPEIDEQHKKMFMLGNNLLEGTGESDIKPLILSLFKYTREHFLAEEKMMNRIGFPLFLEHKALHDALITKLNDVSSQSLGNDEAISSFKEFIFNWLCNHIMTEDNKYFQFSKSQK